MKDELIHIGGRKKVIPQEVIYLKAEGNYSMLYMVDGQKILVATTLKILEKRLVPVSFYRCHKTYLINPDHLLDYDQSTYPFLWFNGDLSAIVSRRKLEGLLEIIQKKGA